MSGEDDPLNIIAGLIEGVQDDTKKISSTLSGIATKDDMQNTVEAIAKRPVSVNATGKVSEEQIMQIAGFVADDLERSISRGLAPLAVLQQKAGRKEWIIRGVVALVALLVGATIALFILAKSEAVEFTNAMREDPGSAASAAYCKLAGGYTASDNKGRACVIRLE